MWPLGLVYNSWLRGRLSHTVTSCLHCLLQEARAPPGERVLNADLAECTLRGWYLSLFTVWHLGDILWGGCVCRKRVYMHL